MPRMQDGSPGETNGRSARRELIGELLEQSRAGSTDALGQLMAGCHKYLLMVANRSLDSDLRPKAAASDLVQDAFAEAMRGFSAFSGSTEDELLAWLTTILNHRISTNFRRYRHTLKRDATREVLLDVSFDTLNCVATRPLEPVQEVIAQEETRQLEIAMAGLPDHMQQVLILRTWQRLSFAEVAAQMAATPGSVRKLWLRAVWKLQKALDQHS